MELLDISTNIGTTPFWSGTIQKGLKIPPTVGMSKNPDPRFFMYIHHNTHVFKKIDMVCVPVCSVYTPRLCIHSVTLYTLRDFVYTP
jgi:hypothetical protein